MSAAAVSHAEASGIRQPRQETGGMAQRGAGGHSLMVVTAISSERHERQEPIRPDQPYRAGPLLLVHHAQRTFDATPFDADCTVLPCRSFAARPLSPHSRGLTDPRAPASTSH